jgi:hypothetical protein
MRLPLFLLFLIISGQLHSQKYQLSDQAVVSVITCGPGQEQLYTAFGHSAFRVHDPVYGYDAAYNYGVFDFDQPNFYLNFVKGDLFYMLGVAEFDQFQYPYVFRNRYVHEQVLDLTQEQKQAIFDALQLNALPKNATYSYDYFYNNCATKIRDVVATVLKDSVEFDGSYIKTNYTIRDLADIYLSQQPWGDLGIDIGLGLPVDKVASPYEYMYLPDYIESAFDHAYILRNGKRVPIVKSKVVLNEVREADPERRLPHPLVFFIPFSLLCVVLTFYDIRRNKLSNWLDILLFAVTGVTGGLLFFLWFFTDHYATARNFNILWAFPLNLIAACLMLRRRKWLTYYFGFITILSALTIVLWPVLPQDLNPFLIPIVIAIIARSFAQFWIRKKSAEIEKTALASSL